MFEHKQKAIKKNLIIVIVFLIILDAILWYFILVDSRAVEFYFLDVGQGDATLLNFPFSGRMLIDSGDGKIIEHSLAKIGGYFRRSVDVWILSHANLDHYGGFLKLIDSSEPQVFIYNGFNSEAQSFQQLINKLKEKNIPIIVLAKGDKIKIGNNQFDILWPPSDSPPKDLNDNSLILYFKNFFGTALFLGDVSQKILGQIQNYFNNGLVVDILKVAHHGSKTSLNKEFLDSVKPKISLIGVGLNNRFNHPHSEVVDFLTKIGSQILRTDINHNIKIIFNKSLEIQTFSF